jgi:hypothetical protein
VGRKLDRLDQVRCYQRLHEMARQTAPGHWRSHQVGRLRDVVGRRLGISGRTLERYLRILATPHEVQDAFQAGQLSLVNASKVAGLTGDLQQQLAADLRSGAPPQQAVATRLAGRAPDPFDAAVGTFIRSLQRNVGALEKHVDQVQALCKNDQAILEQAQMLIAQILRQVKKGASPFQGKKDPCKVRS